MKLEDYCEPLAYDIAFWLQGLEDPAYPLEQLGDLSLEVSDKFRALAIMLLLTRGSTDSFCHHLIRSARARETYLRRLRERGIADDHHQASGRYEPLLDAVAAGDLELARRIAALSPPDWLQGHEYEDDYCYAQVLHRLVQPEPPEEEIGPLLERFSAFQEGAPSARLDVLRALASRNQETFDEAFAALLEERDGAIEAARKRELEEPPVVAKRQVFVEGLALLRLAGLRGLTTEPEYRYCPALARRPMSRPFPGE